MQGVQGEMYDDPPAQQQGPVQPSGVRYSSGAIPMATPAKSACRKFYPSNGREFSTSQTKVIQLPLAAEGQFLDASGHSFLKFDLSTTLTHVARTDASATTKGIVSSPLRYWLNSAGAMGVIRRLRILSATGQQLEDIDDYNALQSLMVDLQCSENYVKSHLKARAGVGLAQVAVTATGGLAQPQTDYFEAGVANSDGVLAAGTATSTRSYSINLMSGLLQQTKYLPLLATKGGIQIEITLEEPNVVFAFPHARAGDAISYSLSNVEYVAELIDFGPEFNMRFLQMLQAVGGVRMSGTTFRTHVGSFSKGQASPVLSISERARSIKSIFTIMRRGDKYNKINEESVGDRDAGGDGGGDLSYQYRVGSLTYPDHPIPYSTYKGATADLFYANTHKAKCAEVLSQAYKAVGGALTDTGASSLICPEQFLRGDVAADPMPLSNADASKQSLVKSRGQFVAAMSFESTTQDTAMLESGLNSAAQALPIEIRFNGVAAGPGNDIASYGTTRVDSYVMCDCIFSFFPNGEVGCSV